MGSQLTIDEINADPLSQIAAKNWSAAALASEKDRPAFDPELVQSIYNDELGGKAGKQPQLRRVMLLEISQYLENYLWPNFDAETASTAHVISIMLIINEKFRENVSAWACFSSRPEAVAGFFNRVVTLRQKQKLKPVERVVHLLFTIHAFQSLESEHVRAQMLPMVGLGLWHAMSEGRLALELHTQPDLAKRWRHIAKKAKKEEGQPGFVPLAERPPATFLPGLIADFSNTLFTIASPIGNGNEEKANGEAPKIGRQQLLYCERFVELLTDLLAQLPTRRLTAALLEDCAVLVKCRMSALIKHPQGKLFGQLVDLFAMYVAFPIDNHTGQELQELDVQQRHYEKVQRLQLLLFKYWPQDEYPDLAELALANCGTVQKRARLLQAIGPLSLDNLKLLVCRQLRLVREDDKWAEDPAFLREVLLTAYERRTFQTEVINVMPLYPTEAVLWDENQVPSTHYTGEACLALPKLNLQFLTFHDYLLRNFNLFRLEATYEVREDLGDVLERVQAEWDPEKEEPVVQFRGWARMALPIAGFDIIEVKAPKVGETKPAAVTADIVISTHGLRGDVRGEWDEVKQHDVLFLLTIRPPTARELAEMRSRADPPSIMELAGLTTVRGAEVIEIKDEEGGLMNDFTGRVRRDEWHPPVGLRRTITCALDTAQYQLDMDALAQHRGEDLYSTFNLLMRRKPKENNFKAVLESMRDLMNEATVVPPWLHDTFLGYGDPAAAQYSKLPEAFVRTIDFKDTFLDAEHLKESFPGAQIEWVNNSGQPEPVRPFRITFPPLPSPDQAGGKKKRKAGGEPDTNGTAAAEGVPASEVLRVESYAPADPGPYPEDLPPQNPVRFTPVQVEAVKSGVQPGLTLVVGPPGTGKTDTAVQIMHVLYANNPGQRVLLITHSNQALNDLFSKLLQRDVPARYLLRLGMGEAELDTEDDFSRVGRVNAMLARRLELLAQVEVMAKQLGVAEGLTYTCETAAYFWLLHVLSRWEKFSADVAAKKTPECVKEFFPFKEYFADAPEEVFKGESYEEDLEKARGCFRHLKRMFQELEECRAFELLKGQADRVNFLMTRQAKVVAMTCTHAALKRREFLELAFQYDSLVMEESAQILEIETFIPMLLQKPEGGRSRLKRVVMIGDHHQLPPVVKNQAFQKYAHLDQSLFTRFVRLGTPYLELNAQGRARPTLAELYNWRYRELGNLPNVMTLPEFTSANAGFAYDYQFIDVGDGPDGRGESEPVPHFFQNLAEAEYLVTVYQYMRLLGYPAASISVLTTYNGQKALLRDVIERRCANNPLFGRPHKVATVDKYQGQQNQYVLLSLVRTRAVGHLRDPRRLVVAMSRARLGLYIFGRAQLFAGCYELQPTFKHLLARPTQLALHPTGETFDACTRPLNQVDVTWLVQDPNQLAALVAQAMTARHLAASNITEGADAADGAGAAAEAAKLHAQAAGATGTDGAADSAAATGDAAATAAGSTAGEGAEASEGGAAEEGDVGKTAPAATPQSAVAAAQEAAALAGGKASAADAPTAMDEA